jgi:peptidoglycan/LPS O-acetylase OafA/YrhL
MKRLYPWYLLCVAVLTICELLFSHDARISLLATALILSALIAISMLLSAIVRWLLPDGAVKRALLRLRDRSGPVSGRQPPR